MADLAVGAALTLVHDVVYLLNKEVNFSGNLREEVEMCEFWCSSMKAKIRESEGHDLSELDRNRVNEVRRVAYEIEEVLDEFMLHASHKFHHRHEIANKAHDLAHNIRHWKELHDLSSKMKKIKKKMDGILSTDLLLHGPHLSISGKDHTGSGVRAEDQTALVNCDDELVGFQSTLKELTQQLTKGESKCLTVSLVGPAGSGKSTLVKNTYNNKSIRGRFHCHAWVHVSRSFSDDPEKLLSSMLAQFCESRKEPIPRNGVTTLNKLRNYLNHRRFLLVLDDIWNEEQWKYFKNVLPSGKGRCRIVVTTRNKDVASCCAEDYTHVHDLSAGLQPPEDMDLFKKKALRSNGGKCPSELDELCIEIMSKCGGSPLVIASVGALLSKKKPVPNEWKIVRDSIGSELQISSIISKILLPSYKDLQDNLRRCFLYLSIFPEDYSVEREKLIRLWVSEQFVTEAKGKRVEDVAEEYLEELVSRNLVTVTRRDFDGRVRSCRVQNLVLEFIVQKSKEENFVTVLSNSTSTSSPAGEKIRHLAVHKASTNLSERRSYESVRSTLFFRWHGLSLDPLKINDFLCHCKFMRVLDLQDAPISEFPEGIVYLPLLRYLSLRNTNIKMIPNSIKKLSFLETLDLKKTKIIQLPKKIKYLLNLRNLLVNNNRNVHSLSTFGTVQGVAMVAGIGRLVNLQKLSLLNPDKFGKIINELGLLTRLRKLGIVQLKEEYEKDLCASIGKMKNLTTLDASSTSKEHYLKLEKMHEPPCYLQRVYLKGRLLMLPDWIRTLSNLFRIRLMWSKLEVSPVESLQFLPNLIELQMVDAYSGTELVFKSGSFKKLKTLVIEQFDELLTIEIHGGALPELQKLSIAKCDKLKNLPVGIKNLKRVEELLLYAMQDELVSRISKNGKERKMVKHIPVIRSYSLMECQYWSCNDLS